jgi:hypothetical protein
MTLSELGVSPGLYMKRASIHVPGMLRRAVAVVASKKAEEKIP